jgi:hypothetical protein
MPQDSHRGASLGYSSLYKCVQTSGERLTLFNFDGILPDYSENITSEADVRGEKYASNYT